MVVKLIKVDVIKPNDGKKDNNSLINPVMYLVRVQPQPLQHRSQRPGHQLQRPRGPEHIHRRHQPHQAGPPGASGRFARMMVRDLRDIL